MYSLFKELYKELMWNRLSRLLQGPGEECGAMTEQRSASLQPLIGRAVVNGGPQKATRLKPNRPPPPPPTSADLDGAAVSLFP